MSYYLQYLGIRLAASVLAILPVSLCLWLGRRAGDFIYFHIPRRRNIALENVERAYGQSLSEVKKRYIARSACQSMAVSLVELFIIKRIKTRTKDRFTLLGNKNLEHAFARGRGVVLVISHLGSWEYLSFLPYLTGKAWAVVVKNVKNPYLNKYIKYLRTQTTVEPIEKMNSMRPVLRQLKKNNGVAILIDQWAGPEGLWLNFFDIKTSTTSIPTRLARKTGCALIPAYCIRTSSGKYEINIHPPLNFDDISEDWEAIATKKLNDLLEEQVRKYPGQWLWAHRRWKDKPSYIREV